MDKELYMQKMQQAKQGFSTGGDVTGNEAYYRPPLDNMEGATNVDHPIPYLEMGSSFVIGLAVGFFIKKSFKMALFILGFALIATFYMESQGIFTINDKVLEESIGHGVEYFDYLVSAVKERITSFQSGVGALAGFVVGLKLG